MNLMLVKFQCGVSWKATLLQLVSNVIWQPNLWLISTFQLTFAHCWPHDGIIRSTDRYLSHPLLISLQPSAYIDPGLYTGRHPAGYSN